MKNEHPKAGLSPRGWPVVLLVLAAFSAVVTGAGLFFLWQEEAKLVTSAQALISAEKKKENLERFLRIYDQTVVGREKISNYFVSVETLPSFIERLEQAAREAGIIYTLSSTQPVTAGKQEVLQLVMATEGDFNRIYRFIKTLENLPYILTINQAYLSPSASGSWRANFNATLASFNSSS